MIYLKTNKDKIKFFRTVLQSLIILIIIVLILKTVLIANKYKHNSITSKVDNVKDKGFIALSYFAVDRDGTSTMISTKRLEEHFEALRKNGYITLTQKDIENYYNKDYKIPHKAMFLMFEDGRKDTAIFASPLMERFNYIGTILSYGNKINAKDHKFLNSTDLKKLQKSTFWEAGTKGYRLSYINVFDRYDNYLGQLNPVEFLDLNKYIGRNYNHYLMDFIRDENDIPKESYIEMEKRIKTDYRLMKDIYKEGLGELPKTYVLMHSNTGQYGTNKNVSKINGKLIEKYFIKNFNREGFCLNDKKSSIYDLTRMQPQAYWYPNHLLMRIKDDTDQDIVFIDGESSVKEDWDTLYGATEFRESSIIITSEPKGRGLIRLKKDRPKDYAIHTILTGNILGTQRIYLRADKNLNKYIAITIKNNNLLIEETGKEVFALDLNIHDQIIFRSIEENRLEALNQEYKTYKKGIKSRKKETKMELQQKVEIHDSEIAKNDRLEYIPEIQINELGNRKLDIYLRENKLSIDIDDKIVVKDLEVSLNEPGYIFLESAWEEYGYSQRNIADDVYDGVFEDLMITDINNKKEVIYINKLQGKELIKENISNRWNATINWFIKKL